MARTILVVEDEPTLRETLVDALEADGFRVVSAADGREALMTFRAERPDLVLLDLMLPELSGIEAPGTDALCMAIHDKGDAALCEPGSQRLRSAASAEAHHSRGVYLLTCWCKPSRAPFSPRPR